jgi:GntR family transcriptional regulator
MKAPLVREPSPSLYSQVRETLRERMRDGTYLPDAQLPAKSELSAQFGVSRITVRQALADLQKEGLIIKVAGKGSFVSRPKASQPLARLEGFSEAMSRQGYTIRNKVISFKPIPASPLVAQQLGLAENAPVIEIKRIRYLDREPVSLEITYLPEELGTRLAGEDLANRDIFLILEHDYGIPLGHADLQIGALVADEALALALQVMEGTALLKLQRLTHTAEGKPLDFEFLYFRGDAFQYQLRVARGRTD